LVFEDANQQSLETKPSEQKQQDIQELAMSKADKRKVPMFENS